MSKSKKLPKGWEEGDASELLDPKCLWCRYWGLDWDIRKIAMEAGTGFGAPRHYQNCRIGKLEESTGRRVWHAPHQSESCHDFKPYIRPSVRAREGRT